MATYQELGPLASNSVLLEKVAFAVVVAAHALATAATPSAAEKAFVAQALASPDRVARQAILFLLAGEKGQDVATITSVSDTAVQTRVDEIVPILVDAAAGV